MLGRFLRARGGNVLPTFAVAAVPLIVATGGVVDYGRAFDQKTIVQDAMDSAALAAGKEIGLKTNEQVMSDADDLFSANVGTKVDQIPSLSGSISGSTITLSTSLHVKTYFLGMIGLNEFVFPLVSKTTLAMGTLEVVMALDDSGSMAGSKISTLKTAASSLATTLWGLGATSTKTDPVQIGIVPFAAAVNVGASYATDSSATWLDKTGVSSANGAALEDYGAGSVSNLSLFDNISNTSWGGCVEERPEPYDVTDEAPSASVPDTLFVPMFAPDAPDNLTASPYVCNSNQLAGSYSSTRYNCAPSGYQSYNNYLPDYPASCGATDDTQWTCATGSADCGGTGTGVSQRDAFARTCKYGTASSQVSPVSVTVAGLSAGPNFMCTTPAITPLTTSSTKISAAITNLVSTGATNILAGVTWGWRLLSPGEPFTQGRDYSDTENQKILILMTDGENTYYPNNSFLKSWYAAFGYVEEGRLGTTSTNQSTLTGKMNDRTLAACTNAKAAGIRIYTVGFEINSSTSSDPATALALLQNCASDSSKYFDAQDESALVSAFSAIGDDISLLRIAE